MGAGGHRRSWRPRNLSGGCAPSFPGGPLSPSVGHALPLFRLAGTSLTFETRVICHSSGEPLLPPCPPPYLSYPFRCPQALGTHRDQDWPAGCPPK